MGTRPTVALIDLGALRHNYERLCALLTTDTAIMAVVKANAYGHGDVVMAKALADLGCEMFGVAFAEEGVRLREAGLKRPVVVLGGICPEQVEDTFDHDLTPVVVDLETAILLDREAARRGAKKGVHVEIDTGMGRMGILPHRIVSFFQEFANLENLRCEGLMSHFAETDGGAGREFSKKQLSTFLRAVGIVKGLGCEPAYLHMANSAAVVDYPESRFNLVRHGLMLYGAYPSPEYRKKIGLRPVMTLKTRILHIKKVPPGFTVSYGMTFATQRESVIATLPVGYGDGLPFALSAKGEVLIRGRRAPVVGRVCMDHTVIDVTDVLGAAAGDEAVLIGSRGDESIGAEDVAEKAGTIPYEILCSVSSRVGRELA